jgi:hypothetical protein
MNKLYHFMPARRIAVATTLFCATGFVVGFLFSLLVAASSLLWAIG